MTESAIPRVLVVDDEPAICHNCVRILSGIPCAAEYALNGYEALKKMEENPYEVVVTDLKMTSLGGMELLRRTKEAYPNTRVVVITGYASVSSAVEVMKLGAFDYLPKPFTPDELRSVVQQALTQYRMERQNRELIGSEKPRKASHQLIGNSRKIKNVISMIQKVAPTESTVFIYGESGTGKELIARAVHANSTRKDRVFFAIDCGTLSGNLLESELFGHVKGAFTGAHKDKEGIFKLADHGTVFLDEISNIGMDVQSKLLRFLESREVLPLGGTSARKVDVRLILATNRNLKEMVAAGKFREDFYYRIYVYPIAVPPLRERKEDILPIAYHFLRQFADRMKKPIEGLDPEAAAMLTEFDWPGNVRELRNVMERAAIVSEGTRISIKDLHPSESESHTGQWNGPAPRTNEELKKLKKKLRQEVVAAVEKQFVLDALSRNDWNITRAAVEVGLQRSNLQAIMKKYDVSRPESDTSSTNDPVRGAIRKSTR